MYTACHERRSTELPHPVINDQALIPVNFEGLFLLSPSDIKQELCKLMTRIGGGIDRYKVVVVGKNGKLEETLEGSALWSQQPVCLKKSPLFSLLFFSKIMNTNFSNITKGFMLFFR